MNKDYFLTDMKNIMVLIAKDIKKQLKNPKSQRSIISEMFQEKPYNVSLIYRRLVVIDSLYNTNANYSYFSFDEMAQKIYDIGRSEKKARKYFYGIVEGKGDLKNLFGIHYGIRKNLKEGAKQMSLMSKYAYYALHADKENYPFGFPIYDSLVKGMYPRVIRYFKNIKNEEALDDNIVKYVGALNELRLSVFKKDEKLFRGMQQFDILDAYLWRMGKIDGGNFSLLIEDKEDYIKFIKNLSLQIEDCETDEVYEKRVTNGKDKNSDKEDTKFDFDKVVVEKLKNNPNPFNGLKNKDYLSKLYEHWKKYIA